MTGSLGVTAGKNGQPELDAVKSMTLAELCEHASRIVGSEVNIHLRYENGEYNAVVGGGALFGTGKGPDPDTAVWMAMGYLRSRKNA